MFKKPKRNFRGRQRDSESDDESHSGNGKEDSKIKTTNDSSRATEVATTATGAAANQNKKKEKSVPKVPSSNTILSFEQEEEGGEVFQIKKPTSSKRIVKQLKKECLKEKLEPHVKTESNRSPKEAKLDHQNGNSTVQVKKEVKEEVTVQSEDEVAEGDDDYESDEEGNHFSRSGNRRHGPSVQDILKSGQIPDANMIHLARKRRQMAREMGGDEFVPLDDTVRFENKSSRLIRDDDNDASDSGDDENLALTAQQKESNRRRLQERILAAEEESHSETSDHEREWEEQQIRKGVSIPAQPVSTYSGTAADNANFYYANYQPYVYGAQALPPSSAPSMTDYGIGSTITPVGGAQFPPVPTPAATGSLPSSKEKLMDRLSDMMNTRRLNVERRDELSSLREMNQERIEQLTAQNRVLGEQYKFFQETRGYVRDLVECMNEKMSSLAYLDRCLMNLWKERAQKLVKRHQSDVNDQSHEYKPGKATATIPLVARDGPEEQARNQRRADREGRRNRRKHAREARGIREHCDGMSTDDEFSISENNKFRSEHERLVHDISTAFDDVMDDYTQITLIKRRFETFKTDYSESYNEAYIGLCLPKLFSPLVKWELIAWNPLQSNCVNFEESKWFQSLVDYGSELGVSCDDDDDNKLLPSIVDKQVLPRLTTLVSDIWNPLSLQQSQRLVTVARHLVEDYPTVNAEAKNTQAFIKAVIQRLTRTLDEDLFMPLYPKQVIENRMSGPSIFFHRQFWLCVKLLKSITLWSGIISERQLQQLALDSLLNRFLVVPLPNVPFGPDFVFMCQAVVGSLPVGWFQGCKGDFTLPQLENFCRCLVNSVSSLPSNVDSRDLVRQIARMLTNIRAINHVVTLASRVNFKIAD